MGRDGDSFAHTLLSRPIPESPNKPKFGRTHHHCLLDWLLLLLLFKKEEPGHLLWTFLLLRFTGQRDMHHHMQILALISSRSQ
jgi:hypothetical protein